MRSIFLLICTTFTVSTLGFTCAQGSSIEEARNAAMNKFEDSLERIRIEQPMCQHFIQRSKKAMQVAGEGSKDYFQFVLDKDGKVEFCVDQFIYSECG